MHALVTYLIAAGLLIVTVFTLGEDLLFSFATATDSWSTLQARSDDKIGTRLSGPTGLSLNASSTVQITLVNDGDVALGPFAKWDVILEVQANPGLTISYLTYTTSTTPSAGQWAVSGIYLDASALTAEISEIGNFNPGEEMIVLASTTQAIVANTYDRATFVTPNGVTAKVIFQVVEP